MKIAWLTDIHLNFLSLEKRKHYYQKVQEVGADIVLISGDIAEANDCVTYLDAMKQVVRAPIAFVAGNHDYYYGRVEEVRAKLSSLHHQNLHYLTTSEPFAMDEAVIVGVDGWADGVHGDYENSSVVLNDSRLIHDLAETITVRFSGYIAPNERITLREKMAELAIKDAARLCNQLTKAIEYQQSLIIVVTHVPPFPESSLYKGEIADKNYLPFYTCSATGAVLMSFAREHPDKEFLVLCGHSHEKAIYQPLPNLMVNTGESEYYKPTITVFNF